MRYVVRWREGTSGPLRQQECATHDEAVEWRAAVKAVGGKDIAVLPQTLAQPKKRKALQILDAEGRAWDASSETFTALVTEVNALLRK